MPSSALYPWPMEEAIKARRIPFAISCAVMGIVTLALMRLPESLVSQLRRNRPLSSTQAGWAYRLMALAAVAQALYVGFMVMRPEKVRSARENDEGLARLSRKEIVATVARNAALIPLLTIVFGLAAFALTGERGGYWLFFVVCIAQLAWYFRSSGEIGRFMSFQPEFGEGAVKDTTEMAAGASDPHYVPPLARGVDTSDGQD